MMSYLVSVAACGPSGETGHWSDPINATVEPIRGGSNPEDDYGLIILTTAIIIIILVIVLVGLSKCVCCLVERKRGRDKFFETIKARHAESKQPLNQPSRFQDRPLPEPPSAALHYYGLNACMMNRGSSEGSSGSSYASVNSSQAQPLINGASHVDAMNYHYLLPKDERDSITSSGVGTDLGSSTKSACSRDGDSVYSKEQTCTTSDPYLRMAQTDGSTKNNCDYLCADGTPNTAGPDSMLEDKLRGQVVFPDQGNTLLLRKCSPESYKPQSPPPVPPRRPSKDNPPLNDAPPPPLTEKTKRYHPNHPDVNPNNIPLSPLNRCNDPHLGIHNQKNINEPNSSGNDNEKRLPEGNKNTGNADNDSNMSPCLILDEKTKQHLQVFHFPPPPSSPPSPDPSSQQTSVLTTPREINPPMGDVLLQHTSPWLVSSNLPFVITPIDPDSFLNHQSDENNNSNNSDGSIDHGTDAHIIINNCNDNRTNDSSINQPEQNDSPSPAVLRLHQTPSSFTSRTVNPYQSNNVMFPPPIASPSVIPTSSTNSNSNLPSSHIPNEVALPTEDNALSISQTEKKEQTVEDSNYIHCSEMPNQTSPPLSQNESNSKNSQDSYTSVPAINSKQNIMSNQTESSNNPA